MYLGAKEKFGPITQQPGITISKQPPEFLQGPLCYKGIMVQSGNGPILSKNQILLSCTHLFLLRLLLNQKQIAMSKSSQIQLRISLLYSVFGITKQTCTAKFKI